MGNNEIWEPVRGYEGLYEVSNLGRVRSLNYHRSGEVKVMKAVKDRGGYLLVGLCKDGQRKFHLVHRLVWEVFNEPIPAGMEINHLDEVKTNNRLDNLEVCTRKENNNYGTHNERVSKAQTNRPDKSKPVQQLDRVTGEVINTYPSTWEAQRQTGIYQTSIVSCCKCKLKSAGGFVWRYVEDVY